jgi:hypothetical protein
MKRRRLLWFTGSLIGAIKAAAPAFAAQATSPNCARWEAGYRELILGVALALGLSCWLLPWLVPPFMGVIGRLWRWALGLWSRCLTPALVVSVLCTVLFLLWVLPGPFRSQLSSVGLAPEYFAPAAVTVTKNDLASAPPAVRVCSEVNFAKPGLVFGLGAGKGLAVQPFKVMAFLWGAALAGALLARLTYWLAGRWSAPAAGARRAAAASREMLRRKS